MNNSMSLRHTVYSRFDARFARLTQHIPLHNIYTLFFATSSPLFYTPHI